MKPQLSLPFPHTFLSPNLVVPDIIPAPTTISPPMLGLQGTQRTAHQVPLDSYRGCPWALLPMALKLNYGVPDVYQASGPFPSTPRGSERHTTKARNDNHIKAGSPEFLPVLLWLFDACSLKNKTTAVEKRGSASYTPACQACARSRVSPLEKEKETKCHGAHL